MTGSEDETHDPDLQRIVDELMTAQACRLREGRLTRHAPSASRQLNEESVMKTIRELREARGESQQQLTDALSATLSEVTDLETGVASPTVQRLQLLTEHFEVREDEINLEPYRSPTLGEQLRDALTE